MRRHWFLIVGLLVVLALAGCTGTTGKATTPAERGSGGTSEEAVTESPKLAEPTQLAPETDGEKKGLTYAQGEEARRWASGDAVNGAPVPGEPFLVGYRCVVHDGTTQYQVAVIGGKVVPAFGIKAPLIVVEAQFQGYNPTIDPESDRQRKAFDAAKAEVAKTNPNATQGGIEYYIFFYPRIDDGGFPEAGIYAHPSLADSPMATGGAYGWPKE